MVISGGLALASALPPAQPAGNWNIVIERHTGAADPGFTQRGPVYFVFG
jgi:hypothetical protein